MNVTFFTPTTATALSPISPASSVWISSKTAVLSPSADFDHDGRQEVFLKNRNAPQLRILKNVLPALPPSIAFRLRGTKSNRDAIGAVVTIRTDKGRQTRRCKLVPDFSRSTVKKYSSVWERKTGRSSAIVRWPSGIVQELHDLPDQPSHLGGRRKLHPAHRTRFNAQQLSQPADPSNPNRKHGDASLNR